MKIKLKDLEDNPWRDPHVDAIDEENVRNLTAQMDDRHGLLPGLWVRRGPHGGYQIAAGHHRKRAALAAGIKEADFDVQDFDEADMVIKMAAENLARKDQVGASLGAVAAAVRFLAHELLAPSTNVDSAYFGSAHGRTKAKESLLGDSGLGERAVLFLLRDYGRVPIPTRMVREDLATLKASKDYARIIGEVRDEIAAEELATKEGEEREAAKRKTADANEAAMKAAARKKTFDLAGVRKHLKTPEHVRTFFDMVSSDAMVDILPVEKQADLAAHLVKQAEDDGVRLTSTHLHKYGFAEAMVVVQGERTAKRKDKVDKARKENLDGQIKRCVTGFGQMVRGTQNYMSQLAKLDNPEGVVLDTISTRDGNHMLGWFGMLEEVLQQARDLGFRFGADREGVLELDSVRKQATKRITHKESV